MGIEGPDTRTAVRRIRERTSAVLALSLLVGLAGPATSIGCRSTRGRSEGADGRPPLQQTQPPAPRDVVLSPAETLRESVLAHEAPFLRRDPQLVSRKFARMARSSFAFFRGTAWLTTGVADSSPFVTAASSRIAILGDPHPENIGAFADPRTKEGRPRLLEFNDFDLAGFGSYWDDLRRLALGIWIVGDMADLKRKVRAAAVEALGEAYRDEVGRMSGGAPSFSLRESLFGTHLDDLLVKPEDMAPEDLESEASGIDDPKDRRETLSADELTLVRALLANYDKGSRPTSPPPSPLPRRASSAVETIKQAWRRNAGVSSFALARFQVLIDGPTQTDDDDVLLELKESTGAAAARLVRIQRQFYEVDGLDPWLGWAAANGREFRVRSVTSTQRRLSAARMAKWLKSSPAADDELRNWAQAFGRLLARGHCRASDETGRAGLAAINEAISQSQADALPTKLATYAEEQADANKARLKLFRQLLSSTGPLLGWSSSP